MIRKIKEWILHLYTDHNDSLEVKAALAGLFSDLQPGQRALNVGGGSKRLHPQVENLDLSPGPGVDHVGSTDALPFADGAFDMVMSQEVFEHVSHPGIALKEIARVLQPGGRLFFQVPFIIGYHPCPGDYWRFTVEGIRCLVERAGFNVVQGGITVGGAVGFYRISVEFWSILMSFGGRFGYRYCKGVCALVLYPIKWLDRLFISGPEANRIAGGYYVVAIKRSRG